MAWIWVQLLYKSSLSLGKEISLGVWTLFCRCTRQVKTNLIKKKNRKKTKRRKKELLCPRLELGTSSPPHLLASLCFPPMGSRQNEFIDKSASQRDTLPLRQQSLFEDRGRIRCYLVCLVLSRLASLARWVKEGGEGEMGGSEVVCLPYHAVIPGFGIHLRISK